MFHNFPHFNSNFPEFLQFFFTKFSLKFPQIPIELKLNLKGQKKKSLKESISVLTSWKWKTRVSNRWPEGQRSGPWTAIFTKIARRVGSADDRRWTTSWRPVKNRNYSQSIEDRVPTIWRQIFELNFYFEKFLFEKFRENWQQRVMRIKIFFKSQWGPPRTPCVIIERIKTHERPAISKICKWAESKCRKRLTSTGRNWPSGWSNPTQLDTNR